MPTETNTKLIAIIILLGLSVLAIHLGCDRQARYNVLMFFFDGVPSKDETDVVEDGIKYVITTGITDEETLNPSGQQLGASQHKPAADCMRCHEKGSRWSRKQLFKQLPHLCYDCHTNYAAAQEGFVHGPVAVGACLFCHDPHQSPHRSLLKLKQPDLCYQCHQEQDVMFVAVHQNDQSVCTQCHDPHISIEKYLLKTSYTKIPLPHENDGND